MSAEAPKSEQIQANVAAALSRLRGELGASSSPVAGTVLNPVPKTSSEPAEPSMRGPGIPSGPTMPSGQTNPSGLSSPGLGSANFGPLPAGPVRPREINPNPNPSLGVRPFEPILGATLNEAPASTEITPPSEDARPKFDLFGTRRPETIVVEQPAAASAAAESTEQPDLLSGMEVPPGPPPPLSSFAIEDEVNGRGRRMRNRLLVFLFLVVVVGGAAWGYLANHKPAEGPVPVITADATPEKVKPADEGGMQVPNQNVQILDNMSGQSTAEEQETVMPAPEQPVAPPVPDTSSEADATAQAPAVTETPPAAATTDQSASTATADAVPSVAAPAVPSVVAPEPDQTTASSSTTEAAPAAQQAAPEPSTSEPSAPALAAPTATPTPEPAPAVPAEPAPAAPATAASSEPTAPAAGTETTETQTAAIPATPAPSTSLPSGSTRIQLAALKSEAAARASWEKLQKAYPDLLGALSLNVETVDKAGTTYYRVQAGPLTDKAAAKQLCAKLSAQKQDCIVAK